MQYLSRAYNYYSGINPATLTGAIDVIVIRHVDPNGEVTLHGSPFHVRFGKLQVIRAGEKRVTLRLPNNLPAPHTAPLSMKVGETGEAFFVLETDEDVPEELMTSPVVMASGAEDLAPAVAEDQRSKLEQVTEQTAAAGSSLTQQPFGDTEQSTALGDVEFLDLNARPQMDGQTQKEHDVGRSVSTPSSMLDTAAAMMPAIPLMSSGRSGDARLDRGVEDESRIQGPTPQAEHPAPVSPPNPMTASPGENTGLPVRDHRLSTVTSPPLAAQNDASIQLPKVEPGQGEAPPIRYGREVVLDTAGYHSSDSNPAHRSPLSESAHHASPSPSQQLRPRSTSDVQSSVLNTFARDLEAALPVEHRPPLPLRATDPDHHPIMTKPSESDISLPLRPVSPLRSERATSEPPPDASEPASPTLDPSRAAMAMDYAWDWSRMPNTHAHASMPDDPTRRETLPPPLDSEPSSSTPARLQGVEENPHLFVLLAQGRSHTFELALCAPVLLSKPEPSTQHKEAAFLEHRLTFQRFIEEPQIVDDPDLVMRYSLQYLTWTSDYRLLHALACYRRGMGSSSPAIGMLPSLQDLGVETPQTAGYAWSKWWRRSQVPSSPPDPSVTTPEPINRPITANADPHRPAAADDVPAKNYVKTLRLSSEQLKQLSLKSGPNTVQFSVTSSYSGLAMCSARIFLWESTDQIVISDIDGTITKSDALGHVYAAIGRDWTHPGIAKLYTDITNNGYRMLYLTSRAIGQADSTRGYLKSIAQGEYRLPEGPVIMSPDRLMASLHREVIMRKPELFKMACLRDIQRLFADHAQEAFFAGFGNRITDAMSYRSVGIPAAKIYTIDSTGVVKTELLQAAGHKGSYIQLNDLVNEVFPPMSTKFKPEFTDFNYWRSSFAEVELPEFSPPSPALSARSDTSSRLSVFGKITGLGRRSSRQPLLPTSNPSSRPSSPLMEPAFTSDELSEPGSGNSSMPGSFEEKGAHFPTAGAAGPPSEADLEAGDRKDDHYDYDDDDIFDDDLLATGEMRNVPF